MKKLLLGCLMSVLLVSSFSYAADAAVAKTHRHAHAHGHLKSENTQPVDINHADANELATLKGIGLKKANVIVAYRQAHGLFKTVTDLTKVSGLRAKTLARLQTNNPGRIVINSTANIK